jgi:hypothetical protein
LGFIGLIPVRIELKSISDSVDFPWWFPVSLFADLCSGIPLGVLVGLGFSFVLQLRFIEARPACILCFAAGENVIFHFPGSNTTKNLYCYIPPNMLSI